MKYSILGFNQEKLLNYNIGLNEVLLLSYIYDAQASPTMSHILEDNQTYTWLNHAKIQADLPIINADERQLKRYIKHLNECGLINSKQVAINGVRGSRAYYGITKECENLRYDYVETEQGSKMSPNTPLLGVKNVPSDNLLILDNKLNNTIPKGIVTTVPTKENESSSDNDTKDTMSEYESKMYSDDVKKMRRLDGGESAHADKPKKKLSLWDKCMQIINETTDDEQLRSALIEFLKLRLQIKDKPFYAPQFKSMVEKIFTLKGDPLRIVQQTLEHGWASFYDEKPNNYNKYGTNDTRYSVFSEHENMSSKKVTKEEWEEMLKNGKKF